MKQGTKAMVTKIGDFGTPDHPIQMGREFKGEVRHEVISGEPLILDGKEGSRGIATTKVLEMRKTGNVYLLKTRNSVYLLQPL